MALKFWLCGSIFTALIAICVTLIFNESLLVPRLHPSAFPRPARAHWANSKSELDNPRYPTPTRFVPFADDPSLSESEELLEQSKSLWLRREEHNPFGHGA